MLCTPVRIRSTSLRTSAVGFGEIVIHEAENKHFAFFCDHIATQIVDVAEASRFCENEWGLFLKNIFQRTGLAARRQYLEQSFLRYFLVDFFEAMPPLYVE